MPSLHWPSFFLGMGIALLPTVSVIALITFASLRRDRNEGNSQPAADDVAPVVVGRAEIGCLVAANDREMGCLVPASAPSMSGVDGCR